VKSGVCIGTVINLPSNKKVELGYCKNKYIRMTSIKKKNINQLLFSGRPVIS